MRFTFLRFQFFCDFQQIHSVEAFTFFVDDRGTNSQDDSFFDLLFANQFFILSRSSPDPQVLNEHLTISIDLVQDLSWVWIFRYVNQIQVCHTWFRILKLHPNCFRIALSPSGLHLSPLSFTWVLQLCSSWLSYFPLTRWLLEWIAPKLFFSFLFHLDIVFMRGEASYYTHLAASQSCSVYFL